MVVHQLLREWPPGYGGVERVAHELGSVWGGPAFSFDVQGQACLLNDPLPVVYSRVRLRSTNLFGRLFLPLPSRSLILLLFPLSHFMVTCLPGGAAPVGSGSFAATPPFCFGTLALFSRHHSWFLRLFIWDLPVDCFAGSPLFVRGRYYFACDVC